MLDCAIELEKIGTLSMEELSHVECPSSKPDDGGGVGLVSYRELGRYFKQRRIELKLNQIDVARHLGYSSSQMVSNWERGRCSPPIEKLYELAQLLAIPKQAIMDLVLLDVKRKLEQIVTRNPHAHKTSS